MTDWTSGYVADIGYTYGYYAELSPLRARLALLNARLALPKSGTACELGFGQGMSANIHAATTATKWYGTDFNPSQAGFAQHLAESFSNSPQLFDQSFAEFCTRDDLPDFDYIGLHGIWSWISDENRAIIVDFVRRKLKVGGVLYISYNTQPGWASMVPVRDLLTQHADVMAPPGAGVVARVDGALAFARKLWAANPAYAKAYPQIGERIKLISGQNRHYVAHEYFNRDWVPMSFAEMAASLAPAKIDFACSANYLEHVPYVHMTPEQIALLDELPDPVFRQSVRDFMVNQQFRRDYWIKGPRRINTLEYLEQIRAQRLVMVAPRSSVTLEVKGTLGNATLAEPIYNPILDLMSDFKVRSIGDMELALRGHSLTILQLHQAVMVLAEKQAMAPAQEETAITACRKDAAKLNRALLERARGSSDIGIMASPVLGGGVLISRFHQLMLLAVMEGKKTPDEWVRYAWAILQSQQQVVAKEGKALETEAENIAELTMHANELQGDRLVMLRALGVI